MSLLTLEESLEGALRESLTSTDKDIIRDNASRKRGEHVIVKGKEDEDSFIVNASSSSLTYVRSASGIAVIYSLTRTGKNVIELDSDDITYIDKNI